MSIKRCLEIFAVSLLPLAACSFPDKVQPDSITPAAAGNASTPDQYYRKLCVVPGSRFMQSIYGRNEIVAPDVLALALTNALVGANLLAGLGSCDFNITANITRIDHAFMSMPFTPMHMTAYIDYTITTRAAGDTIYRNTVHTPYQHNFEFAIPAYIGTMNTIHDTVNGAIAANLAQFVTALSVYKS